MAFATYLQHGGHKVTRKQFEENLVAKLDDPNFNADIGPLLASGYAWDQEAAATLISRELIARMGN